MSGIVNVELAAYRRRPSSERCADDAWGSTLEWLNDQDIEFLSYTSNHFQRLTKLRINRIRDHNIVASWPFLRAAIIDHG